MWQEGLRGNQKQTRKDKMQRMCIDENNLKKINIFGD